MLKSEEGKFAAGDRVSHGRWGPGRVAVTGEFAGMARVFFDDPARQARHGRHTGSLVFEVSLTREVN